MYRFGGMGIGHLMKSIDAGSVVGQRALFKNMNTQKIDDSVSQRSSMFSPMKNFIMPN